MVFAVLTRVVAVLTTVLAVLECRRFFDVSPFLLSPSRTCRRYGRYPKAVQFIQGLPGIVCIADDVVIHGRGTEEHEAYHDFFNFVVPLIVNRLSIDPSNVSSTRGMTEPCSLEALRRFLGMVNYLMKFLPNITILINPQLVEKDVVWNWSTSQ